ncbi:MAG: ABC transporter permease subunit [Chloroflexota bacterium]|nr:ABC transporter permease subunit [Chloroflexota bacterium]
MSQPDRSGRERPVNWRAIHTLALRDLKVVTRSKAVMLPMLIVPLIFVVAIPAAVGLFAPQMAAAGELDDFAQFLEMMPASMRQRFAGYDEAQIIVVAVLEHLFAPMFLIIPLMVASTIAAGSFVGEKERKTLEALLHTPTTDTELFLGKLLASWIPAFLVGLGAFVLYALVVNASGWRVMGGIFFPNAMWVALVLWLAPAAAGLGMGVIILISSRVSTFQDAYQLGGMVVIPVLLLVFGQMAGVLYLNVLAVMLLGLFLWVIDAGILWFGIRTFKRSEIIARL